MLVKYALSAILAFFSVMQPCSFGQAVSGTINGFVRDPSGAVVAGANVTVTNTSTGVATAATTNEAGYYSVPRLVPGNYTARISAAHFKTLDQTGIVLDVDSVVGVDATLSLGSITDTVTIT